MATPENQITVLLIEDDQALGPVIKTALEKFGYTVYLAVDGLFALKWLETNRPNIIITDIMMPRLDGYDFLKALDFLAKPKYFPELAKIPKIILSHKEDTRSVIVGMQYGIKFYVPKSTYNALDLKKKIEKCLSS